MLKRRKWPLKGWHKRFFALDKGMLTYAKSSNDILKGKYHGTVDIGLSVITTKHHDRRIDIDADEIIYHIKVKTSHEFSEWVKQLRHHRLYRQHEIEYGTKEAPRLTGVSSPVDDFTPVTSPVSPALPVSFSDIAARNSFKSRSMERTPGKVAAWLLESHGMEAWSRGKRRWRAFCSSGSRLDFNQVQAKIFQLSTLVEKLKDPSSMSTTSSGSVQSEVGRPSLFAYLNITKLFSFFVFTTHCFSSQVPPSENNGLHTSTSNPSLSTQDSDKSRPVSMPENLIPIQKEFSEEKLRSEFLTRAQETHEALRALSRTIATERERMKRAVEQEASVSHSNNVVALKQALSEALVQNADMRSRLHRIHSDSTLVPEATPTISPTPTSNAKVSRPPCPSNRTGSLRMVRPSISEFYDAPEYIGSSAESSEEEEEEEEEGNSSDISDTENTAMPSTSDDQQFVRMQTGRRSKLPAQKPDTDISLWGLLYKNIGKDLSKISMPVTLNEPLSMLQRLCEELEYSELIDKAAEKDDPMQRMILVAAFTVSPYAATFYRAGQKPFNPLLGETYESIREDKGWRFVAEQVSHHPPISACYCESKNFTFYQDIRIKTKFWGKSMEVQPIGMVNLKLPKYKDHYTWNKATTCVHNLLGGQRWVDHYGEIQLVNHTHKLTCKLTYSKSSYWSDKRFEVYGTICGEDGKVVHHLFGKWNEGLYCGRPPSARCIWRPGSMPDDSELFYGFTRFAIELNEIDKEHVHLYAPTDTRFRPDQRKLEEGDPAAAETEKLRVEQLQRERRKQREAEKASFSPLWFQCEEKNGQDTYVYGGRYWDLRKDPGFMKMSITKIF
ncbi:hypothetical protein CAPTEDRAFT_150458 [Capitella teleta]|uniref:Oxysterol-binding protein n=1 Tax=Capitella teleta TaxID=283909 RepID=R7T3Q8_CAPTE|nr:hypothetical protein CAPTEDRAFT_150458 [Capitella teleta]|eukprot:ELT87291.1 hypothetical protein CAPTEDRAFT_150458 [Capitella teleta]